MNLSRWTAVMLATFMGVVSGGCAAKPEVIRRTADGRHASEAEVDKDEFRLLPPGAVVWFHADAEALFEAEFAEAASGLMQEMLPFADGAGIDPQQDIDSVVGALYATVGSDIVGICRGRFHKAATAEAIEANPKSALGKPIQSTAFAGETMYVVDQVAMTVLTDRTMVFGSQLGVRRVLERVEEGRLNRAVPQWFEALLGQGASDFEIGIDLDSQPVPATLGEKFAFMKDLRAARLLGNFRDPGLNIAGTMTYLTPASATEAAEKLNRARVELQRYELLTRALGIPEVFRSLEAQASDKDAQVVAGISGLAVEAMIANFEKLPFGPEAQGQP